MSQQELEDRIKALRGEIDELEASLPAHSIPPSMLIRIEELEDELAVLESQLDSDGTSN